MVVYLDQIFHPFDEHMCFGAADLCKSTKGAVLYVMSIFTHMCTTILEKFIDRSFLYNRNTTDKLPNSFAGRTVFTNLQVSTKTGGQNGL